MVRSWEQVVDFGRFEDVSGGCKQRRISGHRHGITTDEHDHRWGRPRERSYPRAPQTGARRISDDDIDGRRMRIATPVAHIAAHDGDRIATTNKIPLSVTHGESRTLDDGHMFGTSPDGGGKESHATVRIDDMRPGPDFGSKRRNRRHENLRRLRATLEERARRHHEVDPGHSFGDHPVLPNDRITREPLDHTASSIPTRREHPGLLRHPKADLKTRGDPQVCQNTRKLIHRNLATVDRDKVIRCGAPICRPTSAVADDPDRRAVPRSVD